MTVKEPTEAPISPRTLTSRSVPVRELSPALADDLDPQAPPAGADIRQATPYHLTPAGLRRVLRRLVSTASLLACDIGGLTLGLYGALALREVYHGRPVSWSSLSDQVAEWLPFLALVTALVFWQAGLYRPRELRSGFGRLLGSLILVGLLTLAFAIGTGFQFNTYGLVPTAIVLTAVAAGSFRAAYDLVTGELLRRLGVRRRVLLVGLGPDVDHLRRALGSSSAGIAYEFVGALSPSEQTLGVPRLGALGDLPRVLSATKVDEIIVTDADLDQARLLDVVETAHRTGVRVRIAPQTTEVLARRAEYIPGQGIPLFELRPPALAGADWLLKRSFDIVLSALTIVLGLPLWVTIALAIKLTSRGPVFYVDSRIGLHEREFRMLKFRTMTVGAAEQQPELEDANEADGVLFKIRNDPRVTRVGAILRSLSLDEIPQVVNVLRGEMSIVGPRPLPPRDYERLKDWQRKRSLVLPGMTGLWQISGRSELDSNDLVQLDFYYLERWSIGLDVSIILRTIPAVLARRGAY